MLSIESRDFRSVANLLSHRFAMVSVGSLRRRGTKRSSDAEEGSSSKRVQVVIDNSTLFPPSPSAARDQRLPLQSNQSKPEQRNKGIIASDQRPPVAETWQVFGDYLSTAYLQSASNSDKYKIACRYFHARLALVARGFTIDELKQIFTSCLPAFLGNDYMDNERKRAFREFEKQHDWVEDRLVERIRGYAKLWLQSPGGSYYRDQYLVSRYVTLTCFIAAAIANDSYKKTKESRFSSSYSRP